MTDLQQAIAKDGSGQLKALVQQFVNSANSGARIQDLQAQVQAILYKWTGAAAFTANSRGQYMTDARHLYALEAFMGQGYMQSAGINAGTPNPGPNATRELEAAYSKLIDYVTDSLFAQTSNINKPLFDSVSYSWNSSTNSIDLNVSQTLTLLSSKYNADHEQGLLAMEMFGRSLAGQGSMGQQILNQLMAAGSTSGNEYQVYLATIGLDGIMMGTANADNLKGASGDDVITASLGKDNYLFNLGSGKDAITYEEMFGQISANDKEFNQKMVV